jgi:outer membrane protein assembly factor BamB
MLLVCAGSVQAEPETAPSRDWPRFLGPNANGISLLTGINKDWKNRPPKVLWDVPLGDRGHAGPAVAAGIVYSVDHEDEDDVVRAIDLAGGKDLWTFKYPESKQGDNGHARATPLIDGGRVYTTSRFGLVHCLDAKTGAKLWSRHIVKDFDGKPPTWGISMSPVVDGDKLIVCPAGANASVVALNKKTGETIWQGGGSYTGKNGLGYATPVIATLCGKKQYVVFMGTYLIGVDAENGKELWKLPWFAVQCTATPLVLGDDTIFVTTWYDQKKACALIKVSPKGPQVVWEKESLRSKMATPVLVDGHIYGNDSPTRSLVCIEARTGDLRWRQPGFEHGGLVVVDGVLLALDGRSGQLAMVEITPDEYRELGRIHPLEYRGGNTLRGNVLVAPIVADGKAIVRDRNRLVCIDLK